MKEVNGEPDHRAEHRSTADRATVRAADSAPRGAVGEARPAHRRLDRLPRAVLLDADLRPEGQQPDLRLRATVVAKSRALGKLRHRDRLSGISVPASSTPVR